MLTLTNNLPNATTDDIEMRISTNGGPDDVTPVELIAMHSDVHIRQYYCVFVCVFK